MHRGEEATRIYESEVWALPLSVQQQRVGTTRSGRSRQWQRGCWEPVPSLGVSLRVHGYRRNWGDGQCRTVQRPTWQRRTSGSYELHRPAMIYSNTIFTTPPTTGGSWRSKLTDMHIRTLLLYAVAKLLPPNFLVSNHAICPSISHAGRRCRESHLSKSRPVADDDC